MAKKPNGEVPTAALERIKSLEVEMDSLKADAKQQALEEISGNLDLLKRLGFSYRLVEGSERRTRVGAGRDGVTRQRDPEKPCPICNFVTDPPHDARRHRSQGESKKPFNAEQLAQFGLAKV